MSPATAARSACYSSKLIISFPYLCKQVDAIYRQVGPWRSTGVARCNFAVTLMEVADVRPHSWSMWGLPEPIFFTVIVGV